MRSALPTLRLRLRFVPMALVCGGLGACMTMGPDYQRPAVTMPAAWLPASVASAPVTDADATTATQVPAATEPPVGAEELVNTAWWSAFGDPQLDALIRDALEENKDLRMAALRVDQRNAQLQISEAAGGPQAQAGAQRTRDAVSQNRFIPLVAGAYPVGNVYEVSGRISWELDFWGKVRRSNEAAVGDLLASDESRRALVLSLVADVASSYVTLLSLDQELDLHRRAAASRQQSLELLTKKLEGGGSAEQPVFKARAEYEEAQAELTVKEAEVEVLEHALCALLGRPPGRIERGKPIDALALPPIPGSLPVDLLARRPDVRKAEQELVAANARIGVAKAQYLPSISLTSQSGFASADLSQLSSMSSNFGSFGVTILGPLFTSGRIAGQVRQAEAEQQEKETAYLLSVQTALREVEDALVLNRKTWERSTIRTRQIAALRQHSQSALKRYEGGRSSYLDVLDADRSLFAGEIQFNQTRRDQFAALISVYKAMGGGWSVADAMLPARSAKAN